jgi:hypothetical protein
MKKAFPSSKSVDVFLNKINNKINQSITQKELNEMMDIFWEFLATGDTTIKGYARSMKSIQLFNVIALFLSSTKPKIQ